MLWAGVRNPHQMGIPALAALSPEDLATLTAFSGEGDAMTGAALCVGVFLLAWIGKKWLDYSDALVEEQQAQIRKLAEEMRREV